MLSCSYEQWWDTYVHVTSHVHGSVYTTVCLLLANKVQTALYTMPGSITAITSYKFSVTEKLQIIHKLPVSSINLHFSNFASGEAL